MAILELLYGGASYHLSAETLDEVKLLIESAVDAGGGWLQVVDGSVPAHLFITPGVSIALVPHVGSE